MHRLQNGFEGLVDPAFRLDFYRTLNAMIEGWDFTIVACAIKLDAHVAQYGEHAADPYEDCLRILVDRFCEELSVSPDGGFICAEMRNPGLDRDLRAAWDQLCREGSGNASPAEINEKIVDFTLKDKMPNIAGMQLADLVVTPVGRSVLNLPTKDDEVSRRIVTSKLRRVNGQYQGYGLVVRP